MKNILIAAILGLSSTAASAGEIAVNGFGEYALEKEAFEFGTSLSYGFENVVLTSGVILVKENNKTMEVDNFVFGAVAPVSRTVDLYTAVEFDKKMKYEETTIGAAFRF